MSKPLPPSDTWYTIEASLPMYWDGGREYWQKITRKYRTERRARQALTYLRDTWSRFGEKSGDQPWVYGYWALRLVTCGPPIPFEQRLAQGENGYVNWAGLGDGEVIETFYHPDDPNRPRP